MQPIYVDPDGVQIQGVVVGVMRKYNARRPNDRYVLSMSDRKQINFTIVPDDDSRQPRTYANFCGVNHTPFDFTLTFCEVQPL